MAKEKWVPVSRDDQECFEVDVAFVIALKNFIEQYQEVERDPLLRLNEIMRAAGIDSFDKVPLH